MIPNLLYGLRVHFLTALTRSSSLAHTGMHLAFPHLVTTYTDDLHTVCLFLLPLTSSLPSPFTLIGNVRAQGHFKMEACPQIGGAAVGIVGDHGTEGILSLLEILCRNISKFPNSRKPLALNQYPKGDLGTVKYYPTSLRNPKTCIF